MRPETECLGRKTFSLEIIVGAAKLFTVGGGELFRALPAAG
jgi:hypothetical protein